MAPDPKASRRRLLKALAGVGGVYATAKTLPESWTQPVVDTVSLPAHAQSSPEPEDEPDTFFDVIDNIVEEADSSGAPGILDILVPEAQAQTPTIRAHICVDEDGNVADVSIVFEFDGDPVFLLEAEVPIDGSNFTQLDLIDVGDGCKKKLPLVEVSLAQPNFGALRFDENQIVGFRLRRRRCRLPNLVSCIKFGP